jgi:hypothetical protein
MSLTPSKTPASFVTPTKRAALTANAEAGPSRARPQGASPAYVRSSPADVGRFADKVELQETLALRYRR